MAQARVPTISAQVAVATEKPGLVTVEAVASAERMNDGHPVAGFFVRRRYHGDRFLIAAPSEFSPRWMLFVDEPPKEWAEKLQKILGDRKIEEFMADSAELIAREPDRPYSMAQMQERDRQSNQMDYGSGRVKPRASA